MSRIDHHSVSMTIGLSTLDVVRGTLTMDHTRAPMIEARVEIATPPDLSEIDASSLRRATLRLEQRFGAIGFVYDFTALHAGKTVDDLTDEYTGMTSAQITETFGFYAAAGGASSGRILSLILRESRRSDVGLYELVLQSDECRLMDDLLFEYQPQVYSPTTLSNFITLFNSGNILRGFIFFTSLDASRFDPEFPIGLYSPTPATRQIEVKPGTSLWEALQGPLSETGARIYATGNGALIIDRETWTSAAEVPVTAGVNLLEYAEETTVDPDVWGDAAIVRYDDATPGTGYLASVSSTQLFYYRPLLVEVPGFSPVSSMSPEPPAVANRTLARVEGRAKTLPLTIVNDYRLEPRAQLHITLPDASEYTARVQAIRMDIGGDWQTTITAEEVTAA